MGKRGERMKALVLEKKFSVAVILKQDGSFCRLITSAKVGQEIEIKEKGSVSYRILKPAFLCMMMLLISIFSWNYMVVEAYAYVTIDVNPSVELSLNRLNHVTQVKSLDEKGMDLASFLDQETKGMNLNEALDKTREILEKQNYLGNEENYILLDVSSDSFSARERLKEEAENTFARGSDYLIVNSSDMQYHKQAKQYQLSPGKYRQIEELREKEGYTKEIDDYQNETIEDLFKQAKQPIQENKDDQSNKKID